MRSFFSVTLLLLLLISANCVAQDSAFYFCGKVTDAANAKPLHKACVSLKGTFRSVYTNNKGEFCIKVNKKRALLEITCDFYKKSHVSIPYLIKPDNTIALEPAFMDSIRQEPASVIPFFSQTDCIILDYDFYGDKILVLTEHKGSKIITLFCLDFAAQVLSKQLVKNGAIRFYTDLNGKTFVMKEQSVCEIQIGTKGDISLQAEKDILKYEKENFPFLIDDTKNNYLSVYSAPDYILDMRLNLKLRSRALTYFSVSKEKKQRSLFKNLSDDRNTKLPAGEKTHLDLNMSRLPFCNGTVNYSEIYAPLFKTNNGSCLYDLTANKIENYDSTGRLINTEFSFFHTSNNWTGQIYQDPLSKRFYFLNYFPPSANAASSLAINESVPVTGAKTIVKKLPDIFPAHTRVFNGHLLFLCNGDRSTLYSEKIHP